MMSADFYDRFYDGCPSSSPLTSPQEGMVNIFYTSDNTNLYTTSGTAESTLDSAGSSPQR